MAALFLAGLPSSCFTERRGSRPQPWPWPQSVDVDRHVGRWNACDSVGLDLLESLPNALVPTVPAETPALRPRPLGTEQCGARRRKAAGAVALTAAEPRTHPSAGFAAVLGTQQKRLC